ncbi:alcohol dehydrogenase catalytic domain-containing protein [Rhodoflexus sp.]
MIPQYMQSLRIHTWEGIQQVKLEQVPVPVPVPKSGQVLVRMHAAPVNPSDIMFCQNLYGVQRNLPTTPGFEGCGTVVAHGGGLMAKWLLGKRVSCGTQESDGTWAEYLLADAATCLPVGANIPDDIAACALVNPVSAWALFEPLRRSRFKAMIQTAAAGQLGRMVIRLAQRYDKPLINIVHRPELVQELRDMGAAYVLDSSAPDFDPSLKELAHMLDARYAIDAVAGELSGRVLAAMPNNSELHIYGALSLAAAQIHPGCFIFENKIVKGFWLKYWLADRNLLTTLLEINKISKLLETDLRSQVAVRIPLAAVPEQLPKELHNFSRGKILIEMHPSGK